MQRLHFTYEMRIDYSEDVNKCNFTIKCFPKDTARQKVENMTIKLIPEVPYSWGYDGFGNLQIYGLIKEPHREFVFQVEGDVRAGLSEYAEDENKDLSMIFNHPYGLNVAGEKIREYFEHMNISDRQGVLEKALKIMHELHKDYVYKPCVTDNRTSAEEAWQQGCGVCQDYAHIFISLLHLAGIPARYVTGLIVGEGATHAWVEINDNGKWYALDPTNYKLVDDEHIKIGIGRDASDCTINRGIMLGGGLHIQTVNVSVTPVE